MTEPDLMEEARRWLNDYIAEIRKHPYRYADDIDGLERVFSALAAAEQRGRKEAWQDISTAPKDGTEIDVWAVDPAGNGCRITGVCWELMTDWDGAEFEGWTRMYPRFGAEKHTPTHWRPLPSPPAAIRRGTP